MNTTGKFIDLTVPYENGMRGVEITPARTLKENGWNANTLSLYSHAGTHMDAPMHFEVNNTTIDQIPLENFVCDAWVVDVEGIGAKGLIEVRHLGAISEKIQPSEGLLFKSGWSRFISESKYRDDLPRISSELANWCVEHQVKIIGVEPPSVADVNNKEELTEIHRILLGAGIIIVEGLTNIDKISKEKVKFMAFPLKIKDGDGAPARAFAIEN